MLYGHMNEMKEDKDGFVLEDRLFQKAKNKKHHDKLLVNKCLEMTIITTNNKQV